MPSSGVPANTGAFFRKLNYVLKGLAERTGLEPATPGVTERYKRMIHKPFVLYSMSWLTASYSELTYFTPRSGGNLAEQT
jgi:hypothetical protein